MILSIPLQIFKNTNIILEFYILNLFLVITVKGIIKLLISKLNSWPYTHNKKRLHHLSSTSSETFTYK